MCGRWLINAKSRRYVILIPFSDAIQNYFHFEQVSSNIHHSYCSSVKTITEYEKSISLIDIEE